MTTDNRTQPLEIQPVEPIEPVEPVDAGLVNTVPSVQPVQPAAVPTLEPVVDTKLPAGATGEMEMLDKAVQNSYDLLSKKLAQMQDYEARYEKSKENPVLKAAVGLVTGAVVIEGEAVAQHRKLFATEITDLATDLERQTWRKSAYVLAVANVQISGQTKATDIASLISNKGSSYTPDQTDLAYLADAVGKLTRSIPPATVLSGKDLAIQKAIFVKPASVPVSVSDLTVSSIMKALTVVPKANLSGNASLSETMTALGMNSQKDMMIDLSNSFLDDYNKQQLQVANLKEQLKTGTVDLTLWESLKLAFISTTLALGDLANLYNENVSQPISGVVAANIGTAISMSTGKSLPWYQDYRNNVQSAMSGGDNFWKAQGYAFNKLNFGIGNEHIDLKFPWNESEITMDWNGASKFFINAVFDPINLIGFSAFSKLARHVPLFGRFLAGANDAWIDLTNEAFTAFGRAGVAVLKNIPKSTLVEAQMVRAFAGADMVRALLSHYHVMNLAHVTADQVREFASLVRNAVTNGSVELGTTKGGIFAKWQLMSRYIEAEEFLPLAEKLGLSRADLTTQRMLHVNKFFGTVNSASGGKFMISKGALPVELLVNSMSDIFHVTLTEDMKLATKLFFENRLQAGLQVAEKTIFRKGASTIQMLHNLQDHVALMTKLQRNSKIYQLDYQHGLANQIFMRVDKVLSNPVSAWIDKQLTVPGSRMYLLFANFGPWNVMETISRMALQGANFLPALRMLPPVSFIPGVGMDRRLPVRLIQTVLGETSNLPARYVLGGVYAEVQTVSKAGTTQLPRLAGIERLLPHGIAAPIEGKFLGHKIPGIGAPIGKFIVSPYLRSMQMVNVFYNEVTTGLQAFHMLQQTIVTMKKLDPELMEAIGKAVPKSIINADLPGMSRLELQDLHEMMSYLSLRGPEVMRSMAQDGLGWKTAKAMRSTDELLAQMTLIDESVKNAIRVAVNTHEALKDPDTFIRNVGSTMLEMEIAKKLWAARMFDDFAQQMVGFVPRDATDLWSMFMLNKTAHWSNDEIISDIRSLVTERGHQLTGEEATKLHEAVFNRTMKYMNDTESSLDRMGNALKVLLSGEQLRFKDLKIKWAPALTGQIKLDIMDMLESLPYNAKLGVKEIRYDPAIRKPVNEGGKASSATYHRGVIIFSELNPDKSTVFYELSHDLMDGLIDEQHDFNAFTAWVANYSDEEMARVAKTAEMQAEILAVKDPMKQLQSLRAQYPDLGHWTDSELLYDKSALHHDLMEEFSNSFAEVFIGNREHPYFDKHFPVRAPKIGTSPQQNAVMASVLDVWKEQRVLLAGVRKADHAVFTDRLPTKPHGKDTSAWWSETNTQREALWDKYRTEVYPLKLQELQLFAQLNGSNLLSRLPIPDKELLPFHIAQIFLSNTDNLVGSMLQAETGTLISKQDWIMKVRAQAQLTTKTTDIASSGWSDEAIGAVYERLTMSLGFDPADLSIMAPKMEQLENIRLGLHKIAQTSSLPEETVKALNDWIETSAKNVEGVYGAQTKAKVLPTTDVGLGETKATKGELTATQYPVAGKYATEGLVLDTDKVKILKDEITKASLAVQQGNTDLHAATKHWFETSNNNSLQLIGKMASSSPEYLAIIRGILKEQYPSGYIRVYRGSGRAKNKVLDREFTNITSSRKTALDFEDTWHDTPSKVATQQDVDAYELWYKEKGIHYTEYAPPKVGFKMYDKKGAIGPVLDNIVIKVDDVVSIGSVDESELIIPSAVLKDRIVNQLSAPGFSKADEFLKLKEQAIEQTRKQMALDFTNYDDQNAVDGFMRYIFPFWTYETQRWPYLMRQLIQKPALAHWTGEYMNSTDGGYIPVPGTDVEINLTRGSVYGGLCRLFRKDYPSYYNGLPGAEMIDAIGRFGFYPGLNVSLPMTLLTPNAKGMPEVTDLMPSFMKATLDTFLAVFPKSDAAKKLSDQLFPSRYREYMVMLQLDAQRLDGLNILTKKRENIALTPEEDLAWQNALGHISALSVMESQAALTRFRPKELRQARALAKKLTFEITGIPPETQDWIQRHEGITGKRLVDYIGGLTPLQQKMLYEVSGLSDFSRLSVPMQNPADSAKMSRVSRFWEEVSKIREQKFTDAKKLDQRVLLGLNNQPDGISLSSWITQNGQLLEQSANSIDSVHNTDYFKDIPVTYAQRAADFLKSGKQPIFNPIQELLWQYYEIKPEQVYDPELMTTVTDWDQYYLRTRALVNSLPDELKPEFIATMQKDWTPLRKLWSQAQQDYFRSWNNVRNIALEHFTPEEQAIIQRATASITPGDVRQQLIENSKTKDGKSLINTYNDQIRTAKNNLRQNYPMLDAQLNLWGKASDFKTEQAERIYEQLKQSMKATIASG